MMSDRTATNPARSTGPGDDSDVVTGVVPHPPGELRDRVIGDERNYNTEYGRVTREELISRLPEGWEWSGKRILDLGCGTGRVLRHFHAEAELAEFHGCDLHAPTLEWLRANTTMPVKLFLAPERPPLPVPDKHYDLIFALSVFTHITDAWAEWLLEVHRVLSNDGVFICTFQGSGMADQLRLAPWHEEWSDRRFGMNVLNAGLSWGQGGPSVWHAPWWIRAHWGRAFEIEELRPHGFTTADETGPGVAVMRKRSLDLTPEDLIAPEPGEPREFDYLRANVEQLGRESASLRGSLDRVRRVLRPVLPLYQLVRRAVNTLQSRRSRG
jgi:SAM-dependent methyltransferase